MKKVKWLLFLMALGVFTLGFQACSDDEDDDTTPTPTCTDGIQNGDETGVDCGGSCDPCIIGLMGEWQSSGTNVAPLLVGLFATDSIYAEFRTDMTYTVVQVDTSGAALTLEGTYIQEESAVDGIWTIEVNQTSPAALTSEGIFKVDGNTMQYEIVQTQPDISAIPPTPEAGFGSTNAGALGTANVQVYERIE
jgi:hypothetical protein